MNLRKTRAIVSKTMKMSNSSKLATLITEDHGLVKVVAKGARRPKSVFGASLEPITLINCIYYYKEHRELQTISSTDIIEPYSDIKSDIFMVSIASCIVEIAQSHTALEDPEAGTFDLAMESLNGLSHSRPKDAEKHLWRFVLRLLEAAGYSPVLDKCLICGKKPKNRSVFFSFDEGGFICECTNKSQNYGLTVSPGSLMVMKNLISEKVENLPRLKINVSQGKEIEKIVLQFLAYHSGHSRPPKSLAFLRKIEGSLKH
ncbi:DNA repair protein RecO [Candidatus Latescibacterota bacterium]